MSLRYTKIRKQPRTFNSLFGVTVEQFETIVVQVKPVWQKRILNKYKGPGRSYALCFDDMVLMLLLYYRSYITQEFVGYLFGLDKSNVCRIISKLEPILAKVMAITKEKKLSMKEVESLIVDAFEQPIERPKKGQKDFYSGKKKRHTVKSEIRINKKGRIVHVSKPVPGRVHDFNLFKQGPPLPDHTRGYFDSGYQGVDKIHPNSDFPYKATKNKPLDENEKEYNRGLSSFRVKVEHIIGDIKTFKILSDRYRNKRRKYGVKVNIIAGIVNFKNGFAFG
jgi:hypothetical protein